MGFTLQPYDKTGLLLIQFLIDLGTTVQNVLEFTVLWLLPPMFCLEGWATIPICDFSFHAMK